MYSNFVHVYEKYISFGFFNSKLYKYCEHSNRPWTSGAVLEHFVRDKCQHSQISTSTDIYVHTSWSFWLRHSFFLLIWFSFCFSIFYQSESNQVLPSMFFVGSIMQICAVIDCSVKTKLYYGCLVFLLL
jgi:hypothetical protein